MPANIHFNFYTYGFKFVFLGLILIFILGFTILNCNTDYSLKKIGLAFSKTHHHNDNNNLNIINKDKASASSHKATNTKGTDIKNRLNVPATYNGKIVILTFGDTTKSQIITAKPILDQYGFKASFFITCSFPDDSSKSSGQSNNINANNKELPRMSWNDILALQQDGQDIESKAMTHRDLNQLAPKDLEFEIGGSKQCLENHGINPNIFAAVHGDAWNNPTVINMISKYYGFADNGFADLFFLHCDGYATHKQADCRTYDDSGTLTYANRYSIREDSHNAWDQNYLHNDPIIFQKFIGQVNSQTAYNNKKGFVDAIPIVAYHSIDDSKGSSSTDVTLFASEMKYLHDNGFKVIPMSDLSYDESTNYMYIKTN
jgi:peptidoglycan/xylan/chitin deacetylase (PgdA/CDA1 family)